MSGLAQEIASFIRSESRDAAEFDALAGKLFAYQFARNLPYRRLCEVREATPDTIAHWRQIPAASASAFKRLALSCSPVEDCAPERGGRMFHSSGTTGTETSRHFMDAEALDLYRLSLKKGFDRVIGKECVGIVALMPPPASAPHSSLSFMLEALNANFCDPGTNSVPWEENLRRWISVQRKPACYFGTAFALMNFFDATAAERFVLPEGSAVVETGGFKGRSREVSRDELYGLIRERLGVSNDRCFSEYGMSELASQFYSVGVNGRKIGPPWVRTRTIDLVTGTDAACGEPGLLCHYDLANYNSVLAVQTEDLGILHFDGSFELLGRAPGAILRGCSLLAE